MSATLRNVSTAVDIIIQGGYAALNYGPESTQEEWNYSILEAVARALIDNVPPSDVVALRTYLIDGLADIEANGR